MEPGPRPQEPERDHSLFRLGDRLTVITGFAELMLQGAYGPLSAEQKRVLETLARDAQEAGDLFHDLVRRGLGRPSSPPPPRALKGDRSSRLRTLKNPPPGAILTQVRPAFRPGRVVREFGLPGRCFGGS